MKIDNFAVLSKSFESKMDIKTNDDKALKEQTDKFEAFLIKKILDVSLKMDHSLFGKDAGDKIYNSMYRDALSKSLAGGFGYSELLYNFLKDKGN